jgi:hypothetical protein
MLLGSKSIKALRKTLMKLKPGRNPKKEMFLKG